MSVDPADDRELRDAVRDWAGFTRVETAALRARARIIAARSRELREQSEAITQSARASGLTSALSIAGWDVDEAWFHYAALGGDRGPQEVEAYLHGGVEWPPLAVNIMAHVINEQLKEHGHSPLLNYTD